MDTPEEQTENITKPSHRRLSELDDKTYLHQREYEQFKVQVNWYACYVQPQHELQVHDYLMGLEDERKKTKRGKPKKEDLILHVDPTKVRMECYVPLQRVKVKYSDRMIWKDKIMIPGIIFVHCSISKRSELFDGAMKPYVVGFLCDRAKHRPHPIPDDQMLAFRALADSDYAFQMEVPSFKVGQSVMILSGPMQGHVAELVSTQEHISKTEYQTDRLGNTLIDSEGNPIPKHQVKLCVRLNDLLSARFEINADDVVIVPKGTKRKEFIE